LISDEYITNESSEYYGAWASNYETELELIEYWQGIMNTALAAYCVYVAISGIYYSYLASGTSTTIYSAEYVNVANQVDDLTTTMTVRPSSTNGVMLGTDYAGTTWYGLADQVGMTCFYSPNYNSYIVQYGDDLMQMSNYNFILQEKALGRTFYFSHDPMIYVQNPALAPKFYNELEWLRQEYGITQFSVSNFFKSETTNYWQFIP